MSQSADELKALYDKAMENLLKLHRKETMKAVLNLNTGYSSNFSAPELKAESFLEEHEAAIKELSHEECVEFIHGLSSDE